MVHLEFSENQQNFHYNEVKKGKPQRELNTYGWKVLVTCKNENEAQLYADFLETQHVSKRKTKFTVLEKTIYNLASFRIGLKEINK